MAAKIAAENPADWLENSPETRDRKRERGQVVSLTGDVALLGRSLDVGSGLDHGDVEVLALAAAAAVHLGEPHGGGVLDGAARLPPPLLHRHRAHRRRRLYRRAGRLRRSLLSTTNSEMASRVVERVVARAWPVLLF